LPSVSPSMAGVLGGTCADYIWVEGTRVQK
jgi:hypothetical protein